MSMSSEDRKTLHSKMIEYGNAHQFTKKREVYESIIEFVVALMGEARSDGYNDGYNDGRAEGEDIAMDSGGF